MTGISNYNRGWRENNRVPAGNRGFENGFRRSLEQAGETTKSLDLKITPIITGVCAGLILTLGGFYINTPQNIQSKSAVAQKISQPISQTNLETQSINPSAFVEFAKKQSAYLTPVNQLPAQKTAKILDNSNTEPA